MPLRPDSKFPIAHVAGDPDTEFDEHLLFDGTSWFHVRRRSKQWLLHGTTMSSGSALYVFMEHPEVRHPELEAALPQGAAAAAVYADWLEEQGDPFAAALKPELQKARGPAGLWWLEGFERSGVVSVTLRDGFVREAMVQAGARDELVSVVHRLCHLRACVALEKVSIDSRAIQDRQWPSVFTWSMWTDCQWPTSMKTLSFSAKVPDRPRVRSGVLRAFQEKLAAKFPAINVELDV